MIPLRFILQVYPFLRPIRPSRGKARLFQFIVFLISYGLQPLVGSVFACNLECKVSEPTVGCCSVPVFHAGGNVDDRAGQNLYRRFAFFLIPATTGHTDKHLSAAFRCFMDVPVVAAARLESHVGNIHLLTRNRCEVTVAGEIFGIRRVGFADGENHFALEGCLGIHAGRLFRPYVFGQTERRPCLGSSGIKTDVRDNFGDFGAGDAVVLRRLQMICQRIVGDALTDERCNRH